VYDTFLSTHISVPEVGETRKEKKRSEKNEVKDDRSSSSLDRDRDEIEERKKCRRMQLFSLFRSTREEGGGGEKGRKKEGGLVQSVFVQ